MSFVCLSSWCCTNYISCKNLTAPNMSNYQARKEFTALAGWGRTRPTSQSFFTAATFSPGLIVACNRGMSCSLRGQEEFLVSSPTTFVMSGLRLYFLALQIAHQPGHCVHRGGQVMLRPRHGISGAGEPLVNLGRPPRPLYGHFGEHRRSHFASRRGRS